MITGRYANYTSADTWYPSWGADDRMYSPFTDSKGPVNGVKAWSNRGAKAVVGHAIILGDDPMKLTIGPAGVIPGPGRSYPGRYPCANLHYDGVWYVGTYGLAHAPYGLNWPILGPFGGFHISTDNGKTWTPSPLSTEPGGALFPEPTEFKGPVKLGAPHVVDFGKNMEHSPDGKLYMVGHGSTEPDMEDRKANLSWISGDQIYLCRVTPGVENVNDESKYEYFAGHDDAGEPAWSDDFAAIKPLIDWDNNCGCVTITYNAPLKKYLMCITDGWPTVKTMNSYVLEADRITGPYRMVQYLKDFGPQAYFLNIPSRFISADGRTIWLCYSANFTSSWCTDPTLGRPLGSVYAMSLHEMKLGETEAPRSGTNPLLAKTNVARLATVTASSTYKNYSAKAVTDGRIGGYPGDIAREWASNGETDTAFIRLTWKDPQTVSRVWLFDRPNTSFDQVTGGMLVFSDGSTITTDPLPDDAARGVEVSFEPKTIRWLAFFVTSAGPKTQNSGLSEIAVFSGKPIGVCFPELPDNTPAGPREIPDF